MEELDPVEKDILEKYGQIPPIEIVAGIVRNNELLPIADVTFAGDDLLQYATWAHFISRKKGKITKYAKDLFMVKRFIRAMPHMFERMPKVHEFRIKKLETLLIMEWGREVCRRNVVADHSVKQNRPDFDSGKFINWMNNMILLWAGLNEADSFYAQRGRDTVCAAVDVYETLKEVWGDQNRVRKTMYDLFKHQEDDHGMQPTGAFMAVKECQVCQDLLGAYNLALGEESFMKTFAEMWTLEENANLWSYRMIEHQGKDHKKKVTAIPEPVRGCKVCKDIQREKVKTQNRHVELFNVMKEKFEKTFGVDLTTEDPTEKKGGEKK